VWIGTESPKSRFVAAWTNVRLARSVGCLFARKVAHACKIVSSTIAKIDGAINSAEATKCTRTSNTLRNTLLKKLVLRPSARLWRGLRTTQTPSFAKRRTFRVLSRCGIHAHAITSAYVCENAATVVENTSTRRTHFTTCRRASDVEGATRTAIRSKYIFSRVHVPLRHPPRMRAAAAA